MSGTTRASVIATETVPAALREVALDARIGASDRLKELRSARRPDNGAPERTYRIMYGLGPARGDLITCDYFVCELTIELYYALTPGAEARSADDAERFWWVLETLQQRNDGIQACEPRWLGLEETQHNLVARISLVVAYRLDPTVITN